jgi:enoyl-CoA hydratase/carnithine racemase
MHFDVTVDDGVAHVVLDGPPLNLLRLAGYDQLAVALAELAEDESVHALVMRGAGGRAFSAGADLHDITSEHSDPRVRSERAGAALAALRTFPLPTFAAVEGYALGAGMVLAACCDFRIAAATSVWGMPEVTHGLAGGGAVLFAADLPLPWQQWLVVTGERIDGETAHSIGLVQLVDADPVERALALARRLAGFPRHLLVTNKRLMAGLREDRVQLALARESDLVSATGAGTSLGSAGAGARSHLARG